MISKLLYILAAGLKQLQLNAHFLLVAVLLLVLPGIYIWLSQSILDVAYQNINTAEKQSISLLHDALTFVLLEQTTEQIPQTFLSDLLAQNERITKARILKETSNGLEIIASGDATETGLIEGGSQLYVTSATVPGESLIFDFSINSIRTWQAFRQVRNQNTTFYIFTEHTFADVDEIMLARQQQTYLGLPFIFAFLMLLAYWLLKQTQWQKMHAQVKNKLDEQMLFSNTIAHELRAPLTAIRGYISFLLESPSLDNKEKLYATNINKSAERLLALINDFLEVARIQSGKLKVEFVEQDVRDVINAVEIEFKELAKQKNLLFKIELPSKPVLASTDSKRLQQVITNLVSNAIKYTDTGSVTVSLEQTKLRTIIAIKDTGHGISAEDQQKLFGAFTRVGSADKGKQTGTGLGMWITKQLIELLHGKVTVESIEGVGTHVKLIFEV